jgi:flagellar M-ring protein FliF
VFERFRALSQSQQVLLITAGVVVFSLLLGSVWYFGFHTTYSPLFTELRTVDAATIVADLDKKKIPYRLADGGSTILVAQDRVDATRLGVMTEDLPLKGTVGFELFNKSDLGLTDFAQKINYQRALQGELERTIMTLDDVEAARVHLSLGEDRIFRDDRVPPKASVTVRMKNHAQLSTKVALGIQRLVAAAVPNLNVSEVVILGEEGQLISTAPPSPIIADTPYRQEIRAIEEFYVGRVREALADDEIGKSISVSVVASVLGSVGNVFDWSPSNRKFPVSITLSSPDSLTSDEQSRITGLVTAAVRSNESQEDGITFGTATGQANDSDRLDRPHPPTKHPIVESASEELPSWPPSLGFFLIPIAILLGVILIVRQARRPTRLTEQQRAEFVTQLRNAMAGDHASQS